MIIIIILAQKKKEPNLSLPHLSLTRNPPFPWLLSAFLAFAMKEIDHSLAFIDDLLDFNSDIGEGVDEEDEDGTGKPLIEKHNPNGSPDPIEANLFNSAAPCSAPAGVEEELEWISNKDAFPSVYTFVDNFTEQSCDIAELSTPVSVLENTSTSSNNNNINKKNKSSSNVSFMSYSDNFKVPSKARSKILQKRRQEISSQMLWTNQTTKNVVTAERDNGIGRKCQHCGAEKTPQWRAGPLGPKTLCNACGVRFKSGRLVSEYRPASSPSFSPELHSNSHRKVMEMRRKKEKTSLMNSVDKG